MPTWNDPNPLANPLNSRRYSNFNAQKAERGGYINTGGGDPSGLEVPNQDVPPYGTPEWDAMFRKDELTVPNQDVPPGDQLKGHGFLPGSDRLFRLSDGALIDFRSGRIFGKAKSVPGYWGDPNASITMGPAGANDFAAGPSIEDMIGNLDAYRGTALPGGGSLEPMDPASAAYWLKAQEEAEKMKSSMTDEQKASIAAFEARFPKSKLIEESRKLRKGRMV